MHEAPLDERQAELVTALVAAWEASKHVPFDFPSDARFEHPSWPTDVRVPSREEIRGLLQLKSLERDESTGRTWRVFPSAAARLRSGAPNERQTAAALRDPDQRLAVILEATVDAFEADPATPLHFAPMEQIELVQHAHWLRQPDIVRAHDLEQLHDLGLIALSPRGRDLAFWPTSDGRAAVREPAGLLERRAENSLTETEASRLRRWAAKLRAGDIAVGAVAASTAAAIRALVGL